MNPFFFFTYRKLNFFEAPPPLFKDFKVLFFGLFVVVFVVFVVFICVPFIKWSKVSVAEVLHNTIYYKNHTGCLRYFFYSLMPDRNQILIKSLVKANTGVLLPLKTNFILKRNRLGTRLWEKQTNVVIHLQNSFRVRLETPLQR